MDIETARGIAARAWCEPSTSGTVMDVELAEEFAKILVNLVPLDYTTMDGGEMIHACGTDAAKWATAFMQYKAKNGSDYVSENLMLGWFANAIMHTHDTLTGQGPVVLPDGSAVVVGSV